MNVAKCGVQLWKKYMCFLVIFKDSGGPKFIFVWIGGLKTWANGFDLIPLNLWLGCGTVNFLMGSVIRSEEWRSSKWRLLETNYHPGGWWWWTGTGPLLNLKGPWKMSDFSLSKDCQKRWFFGGLLCWHLPECMKLIRNTFDVVSGSYCFSNNNVSVLKWLVV